MNNADIDAAGNGMSLGWISLDVNIGPCVSDSVYIMIISIIVLSDAERSLNPCFF